MRRYDGDAKECSPQYWRKSSRPFRNFFHRFDRRVIPRVPASAGPTQMCTIPERLIFHRVGWWVGRRKKQSCGDCLPGFLCGLRLAVNNSWRAPRMAAALLTSREPESLRGSDAGISSEREREAPLRDQNGQ